MHKYLSLALNTCLFLLVVVGAYVAYMNQLPKIPTQIEIQRIVLTAPTNSGIYQRDDDEMCIVCAGKNLRCGDDLTRADLMTVVKALVEDGDLLDLCPAMFRAEFNLTR